MSDEMADREHPAAEKLSAYQANELSPEENEAIRQHVASCALCAERLLDLQRFLDFMPEIQGREGVVDLETAAEWRRLRRRIEREKEKKRFFNSARGGYSVAAALLVASFALVVWNLKLVRENRQPQPVNEIRTLEARESFRSGAIPALEESVSLPAQISLSLPAEAPEARYRVELTRQGSSHVEESLELSPQGPELRFFLPDQALPPGSYILRVRSLRGGRPSPTIWTYELTIGPSSP